MQQPLVDPHALAEGQELERVLVVRDERDLRLNRLAVDHEAERLTVPRCEEEGTKTCKRVSPPAMAFSPVDERRVDPERDVVEEQSVTDPADVDAPLGAVERGQGSDRIVAVEAGVAREMVAGPERDGDEREVPLDRKLGDRCQ